MSGNPAFIACLLGACLGLASCKSIEESEVHAAYMHTDLQGDVAVGPSSGGANLAARRNDITGDLGIDDSQPAILFGGSMKTPIGRFGGSIFWFEDSGSGTLARDFGDIPIGATVASDFEFLNAKTYWVYDVLEGRNWRVSPGVAVDFFDSSTTVRAQNASQAFEEVDVFAPVPLAFLDAQLDLADFSLNAQGGGMQITLTDGLGTYWDAEASVRFRPTDQVDFRAGYRFLSMDTGGDAGSRNAEVDLQVQGWFLGGGLHF